MDFKHSDKALHWQERVTRFLDDKVLPRAADYWAEVHRDHTVQPKTMESLKAEARDAGLWNMFLPGEHGTGLTNLEYAPLAEAMGRAGLWTPEVFNCNAPDTGNMEVLHMYGNAAQQERWLKPLMAGEIRSAFLMTEPAVASSDATNIQTSIVREGDEYVINGRKWWSTNMGHPNVAIAIVMGKTDTEAATHAQQSQILVPTNTPGFRVERMLTVFGYDERPIGHAEVVLDNVRVPVENLIAGEGRGFEIAQGRLGPGRIHHCMRVIGAAEKALELMCQRLLNRTAFRKTLSEHSVWEQRVGEARTNIEMCRLMVLKAAWMMDNGGAKNAKSEIAQIKVAAPRMALQIIDDAIQAFGGAGVSGDTPLAEMYAAVRTLRLADGPDEVHNRTIARLEYARHGGRPVR
ncbi:acyl-CoA dehydrogenase family protein [Brevundimonas sp. AJA228-03]|uniref:acyl-CoA dehydrogenase family protein n=1 Tax=Brevundimonas sp. AJA228-03 TaxID=2752515 RepID=UPI001ADF83B9|nr:acyl-CoA dehydrogenase family protein [Brevundimonas sp. AJA228-03]QTN18245.1 acyl-CoA dehydrogenase family protein [Brevundimonas sp. AJA228-03]